MDWLGSGRFATDKNGNIYYDAAYGPWGEPFSESGTNDRLFTGQTQDLIQGGIGIYNFLFRQHSPTPGRWLVPDPAGLAAVDITNPQTWNRYAYVGNNPLSLMDPLGLCGGQWTRWSNNPENGTLNVISDTPCPIVPLNAPIDGSIPVYQVEENGTFRVNVFAKSPRSPKQLSAANNGQQPQHTPQHQQCVQAAIEKANDTAQEVMFKNIALPFKNGAKGAVSGAIVGCVLTVEGGCIEGAIPGALTGIFGGILEGVGEAVYRDITGYRQAFAQLKTDIAACPP